MRSHRSGADGVVGSAEVFRNAFFRRGGSILDVLMLRPIGLALRARPLH